MKKVYWWVRVVMLSLRWIPRLNLGRQVWWRGEKWTLVQGTAAPLWDLAKDGRKAGYVHERWFTVVQTPSEWWKAFRSGYRFYMNYWYGIWVNEGIQPWMKKCDIWAKDRVRT